MLTLAPTVGSAFRFSGHESFACRYAWLPKAYRGLQADSAIFTDESKAMVEMGLGKNMVRSLRFWTEAMGLASPSRTRGHDLTEFAHTIFGPNGQDPFLEDQRTLWLLHWKLASRNEGALFAWRYLFSLWPYPEFTRSDALAAFLRESEKLGHSHSPVTLGQHLDVFLHSYQAGRAGQVALEDTLDGPLVELDLIQSIGERKGENGRFETVYAFRREAKPEISPALFDYCVADFWQRFHPTEASLTLREVALAPCSPGQVFKLPENDIRSRLEAGSGSSDRPFTYQPSAVQGLLFRTNTPIVLAAVYEQDLIDA